jgi:hypothetical protein
VKDCYRSPSNRASQYVATLRAAGQQVRFNNKACSGAVTANMLNRRRMDGFPGVFTATGRFTSTADPAAIKAFDDATRCTSRSVSDRVEETWSVVLTSNCPSEPHDDQGDRDRDRLGDAYDPDSGLDERNDVLDDGD